MSQPVSVLAAGIQSSDGLRATSKISINNRVTTSTGPIGVISDVMQFPGPPTVVGNWVVGTTRVLISGVPAVNQVSTGIGYSPVPSPTGPLTVVQADTRVMAL
jgi:hypothetical protein